MSEYTNSNLDIISVTQSKIPARSREVLFVERGSEEHNYVMIFFSKSSFKKCFLALISVQLKLHLFSLFLLHFPRVSFPLLTQ